MTSIQTWVPPPFTQHMQTYWWFLRYLLSGPSAASSITSMSVSDLQTPIKRTMFRCCSVDINLASPWISDYEQITWAFHLTRKLTLYDTIYKLTSKWWSMVKRNRPLRWECRHAWAFSLPLESTVQSAWKRPSSHRQSSPDLFKIWFWSCSGCTYVKMTTCNRN